MQVIEKNANCPKSDIPPGVPGVDKRLLDKKKNDATFNTEIALSRFR